jgi:hypothetical protein
MVIVSVLLISVGSIPRSCYVKVRQALYSEKGNGHQEQSAIRAFGIYLKWTSPALVDNKLSLSQTNGAREHGRKEKDVSGGAKAKCLGAPEGIGEKCRSGSAGTWGFLRDFSTDGGVRNPEKGTARRPSQGRAYHETRRWPACGSK